MLAMLHTGDLSLDLIGNGTQFSVGAIQVVYAPAVSITEEDVEQDSDSSEEPLMDLRGISWLDV